MTSKQKQCVTEFGVHIETQGIESSTVNNVGTDVQGGARCCPFQNLACGEVILNLEPALPKFNLCAFREIRCTLEGTVTPQPSQGLVTERSTRAKEYTYIYAHKS